MRGLPRTDYCFFGGKSPFQRHLENQRETSPRWSERDPLIAPCDVERLAAQTGPTLATTIHRRMLTRRELEKALKALCPGRPKRTEYYAALEQFRSEIFAPALHDFAAHLFPTMRKAVLAQLERRGIVLEPEE